MNLYYTAVSAPEAEQSSPGLSLGGFKSGSKVPNARFNNLFGDITATTVVNFNQNRFIGLVLKNETGAIVSNLKLWFTYPTKAYSVFRVAAVDMALNANSQLQMEHVDNIFSKPLIGEFVEANGEANAVSLGELAIGEQIGLWIEMELLLEVIKADENDVYKADPTHSHRFLPIEKEKFDDIGIHLKWD